MYQMLCHYKDIGNFVRENDDEHVEFLFRNETQDRSNGILCSVLAIFDVVTTRLEQDDETILTAQVVLDTVIKDYLNLECILEPNAPILHTRHLKRAIVKVRKGIETTLGHEENDFLRQYC